MDRRAKIVEAALDLFWTQGFGSTSIADILARSNTNSGSLYHFFPSKEDVLVATLEYLRDSIGPMLLTPAWEGVSDPIDRIFALLDRYRGSLVNSDCTYGCPIGSLALELREPDPKIRYLLVANFDNWTSAVEGCLREARSRFPADLDRGSLAQFVLATMEGGVMQSRTHRDIAYYDRSVATLRKHFNFLEGTAGPSSETAGV